MATTLGDATIKVKIDYSGAKPPPEGAAAPRPAAPSVRPTAPAVTPRARTEAPRRAPDEKPAPDTPGAQGRAWAHDVYTHGKAVLDAARGGKIAEAAGEARGLYGAATSIGEAIPMIGVGIAAGEAVRRYGPFAQGAARGIVEATIADPTLKKFIESSIDTAFNSPIFNTYSVVVNELKVRLDALTETIEGLTGAAAAGEVLGGIDPGDLGTFGKRLYQISEYEGRLRLSDEIKRKRLTGQSIAHVAAEFIDREFTGAAGR